MFLSCNHSLLGINPIFSFLRLERLVGRTEALFFILHSLYVRLEEAGKKWGVWEVGLF